ncbi:unnamed protein product [Albugo candida]|uniref:Uncharacterized protein n=1 Tax=Albugo candida TaxID=65357 RepID=A0A024FUB3_9STRA|nr:unnamed protein product [Albugo candida]|eukprot:CCI10720.1 unnamed protein product [Albugo candida]
MALTYVSSMLEFSAFVEECSMLDLILPETKVQVIAGKDVAYSLRHEVGVYQGGTLLKSVLLLIENPNNLSGLHEEKGSGFDGTTIELFLPTPETRNAILTKLKLFKFTVMNLMLRVA